MTYGERTWVLWSATKSKRRESTLKEGIRKFPLQHLISGSSHLSEEQKLFAGFRLLNLCKHHMVDATVDVSNGNDNNDVITNILPEDAFERLITSVLTCSVLVLFPAHVGAHFNRKPNIDEDFDGGSSNVSVMDDGAVADGKTKSLADVYEKCNMMINEPSYYKEAAQMDERKLAMKEELMMINKN
ncbi:hypothetical protein LWI28_019830 [Acer negundo]|uniref:Uncharacterized protein n=1 Tax=Acer negundo TaxID=4023 RepID=A0AAD5NIF6_ACENE|nr:hypothetical protein LWI28_019830 [Acer negundo]